MFQLSSRFVFFTHLWCSLENFLFITLSSCLVLLCPVCFRSVFFRASHKQVTSAYSMDGRYWLYGTICVSQIHKNQMITWISHLRLASVFVHQIGRCWFVSFISHWTYRKRHHRTAGSITTQFCVITLLTCWTWFFWLFILQHFLSIFIFLHTWNEYFDFIFSLYFLKFKIRN